MQHARVEALRSPLGFESGGPILLVAGWSNAREIRPKDSKIMAGADQGVGGDAG